MENGIAHYEVTEAKVKTEYSEFYPTISKETYDEMLKVQRKKFLRWQMIEHMKEFTKLAYRIDETWHKMDEQDWEMLSFRYPFDKSFDEMCGEIDFWTENMETLFKNHE
jgi:hypothetical protein